ncbi:MAG: DnaJ domain-containing protein [Cyanobacteria bacterium P01_E01_bin.34]
MNYYQVLEVAPDATPEDIKRAYRQLVRRHHPDVASEDTGDRFHQIQAAYEILSDPGERRKYDLSVGWGRSPRTAIPYRPARAKTGTASPSATQPPTNPAKSPKSAKSAQSPQPSSRTEARGSSAGIGTSNRSKFVDNTEFSNGGHSPKPRHSSKTHQPSSAQSTRPRPGRDSRITDTQGRDSHVQDGHSKGSRPSGYGAERTRPSYQDRPIKAKTPNPTTINSYTQRMRTVPSDSAYANDTGSPASASPSNPSSSSANGSNRAASQHSTSAKPSSDKPYSSPARPEPEIPNLNRGMKSLKEALRSNRSSLATDIADQLVAHYSSRPQVMRLFVKAYHLRGNEMLYYKRYELAEIYLYEALKTAHANYPELVRAIQSDLDRMDTNRRELGMI